MDASNKYKHYEEVQVLYTDMGAWNNQRRFKQIKMLQTDMSATDGYIDVSNRYKWEE